MSIPKMVIYTSITNDRDILKKQDYTTDVPFVAFLDRTIAVHPWKVLPACDKFLDPVRNAKHHKILPHVYFPEAEYSLWIDGSVSIVSKLSVCQLIETFLKNHDLVIHKHYARNCIYEEALACLHLDDRKTIENQINRYKAEGYPVNAGLSECGVILRRHTDKIHKFNEMWWDEISNGSRRDQLSFNYVARKLGLTPNYFPETINPNTCENNPHFQSKIHK